MALHNLKAEEYLGCLWQTDSVTSNTVKIIKMWIVYTTVTTVFMKWYTHESDYNIDVYTGTKICCY